MRKLTNNYIAVEEFDNNYTIYKPLNFGWVIKNYTKDCDKIRFLWNDGSWGRNPYGFTSRREAIQKYKLFINKKNCIVSNEFYSNGDIFIGLS